MYYDQRELRASGQDHVIFDGVDLNDYFEVTAFGFNALPTISAITTAIPNKPGEYFYGRQVGTRKGTIRLTALADDANPISVYDRWLELSKLINKNEPRRLYLNSDKYLNAMLVGETPITIAGNRGTVELAFTAFDPAFHGREHVIPLKVGTNTFRVISTDDVFPIIEVTGASGALTVRHNETYDQVRIPQAGSAKITIDMENMKCYSNSEYIPVDITVTDFFTLPAGEVATIYLSSGTGTLTYEERS